MFVHKDFYLRVIQFISICFFMSSNSSFVISPLVNLFLRISNGVSFFSFLTGNVPRCCKNPDDKKEQDYPPDEMHSPELAVISVNVVV